MKIIYLIAGTYRAAGMERVLANKADWLASRGYDVLIVTTDQLGREPAFRLDPSIRSVDLDINYEENNGGRFLNKVLHYPLKQWRHRRRLSALLKAEKADVVVSMFCNDAAFLPFIKDGSRKVLEIHFSRFKRLQYGRKGLWALADRFRSRNDLRVVSRFDRFVVLTQEDRGYWEAEAALPNICVIPNARTFAPAVAPEMPAAGPGMSAANPAALAVGLGAPAAQPSATAVTPAPSGSATSGGIVLAAGRYNAQKAFDRLIEIWKTVAPQAPGWKLRIAGEGELRQALQQQIDAAGLHNSVILGKAEGDIRDFYAAADIYALTSLYEGLPMVLLEAQSSGLPIVAMACKCGPRDVVTDGEDGFLVPEGDNEAMADKLLELINDPALRHRMGAAALRASDRFDEAAVMQRWTGLFRCQ